MSPKIDRRVARTQKALHGALMALIQRKGYEAVTVEDIVDEADVGRSTFYSHYTGKDDLLRRGFKTLRDELAEAQRAATTGTERAGGEPLGFSLAMFEHAGEYSQIYRAMVGGRGGAIALDEIRHALSDVVKKELPEAEDDESVPREVRIQFAVGTFITLLTWWLERRQSLPPAEVDRIFRQLVLNGIGAPRRGAFPQG